MRYPAMCTGICVVRAEAQPRGLHITLRLVPDISRASTERTVTVRDADEAAEAVRAFLRELAEGAGRTP